MKCYQAKFGTDGSRTFICHDPDQRELERHYEALAQSADDWRRWLRWRKWRVLDGGARHTPQVRSGK